MSVETPGDDDMQRDTPYWRQTRRMTLHLLLLWFVVTFLSIFFARDLAAYTLFGWPVSFFMAAQGSTLIYFAIVAFYAWRMGQLDRRHQQESGHGQ